MNLLTRNWRSPPSVCTKRRATVFERSSFFVFYVFLLDSKFFSPTDGIEDNFLDSLVESFPFFLIEGGNQFWTKSPPFPAGAPVFLLSGECTDRALFNYDSVSLPLQETHSFSLNSL